MIIQKYSVGQLQANCYFLIEDEQCLLIDPGDDAHFLLEKIQSEKLKLLGIFVTHGHFDHILGVGEMQLSFPVPLYIFREDEFLVKRVRQTARHFLRMDPHMIEPSKLQWLKEGRMTIGPFTFEVLQTSGHTPGACCFYFAKEKVIFTGDTLFKNAVGRYDLSYSDKNKLKASLTRLFSLPGETIVYPGHGEETLLKDEKGKGII